MIKDVKNLLIVGAGGYGREVLMLALDNPNCGIEWRVKGFLDTRSNILDGFAKDSDELDQAVPYTAEVRAHYRRDYAVIGDPLTYVPVRDDVFICAIGDPIARQQYASPLIQKRAEWISLFHPRASVSAFASIGMGCVVGPFAAISPDVKLGHFVTINSYTGIGHDASVGDWCEIDSQCLIAGRARIGNSVRVHAGAIITPGIEVGDNAVVAAGAVVFGRVPARATVVGNPARKFNWRR